MKIWILKAAVQKVISFLPFSHRINFLFQKYVTRGVNLTNEYFEDRLIHFRNHIEYFEKYSGDGKKRSLELGTGWYPIIPVAMSLYSFEEVVSVDINSFVNKARLITTLQKFSEYYRAGKLQQYLIINSIAKVESLIAEADKLTLKEMLHDLRINLMVGDAQQLPLKNNSVDLITSNNTFEHIYPAILKGILLEFARMVQRKGVMSHFIDMSDHFSHLDASLTIYNFLKFSDKEWKRIDNDIQPQNRWRLKDYEEVYEALQIPITEKNCRAGYPELLRSGMVNEKFKNYSEADLAISHCYVISKF